MRRLNKGRVSTKESVVRNGLLAGLEIRRDRVTIKIHIGMRLASSKEL